MLQELIAKSVHIQDVTYLASVQHLLKGTDKEVVDFIIEYTVVYSTPPTVDVVIKKFPSCVIKKEPTGKIDYYYNESLDGIRTTYLNHELPDALLPDGTIIFEKFQKITDNLQIRPLIMKEWEDFQTEHYSNPRTLVQFPTLKWFNEALGGGLGKTDFVVLYGRLKSKKSFVMSAMVMDLLRVKQNVLMFNNELDEYDLFARFDSLLTKRSLDDFRFGNLTQEDRNEVLALRKRIIKGTLIVSGSVSSAKQVISAYHRLKEEQKPNVIVIDAFELMRKGNNTGDVTASLSTQLYELRQFSLQQGVAFIITTQENRSGGNREVTDASTIANSDSFGQIATLAVRLANVEQSGFDYTQLTATASRNATKSVPQLYLLFHFGDTMKITQHQLCEVPGGDVTITNESTELINYATDKEVDELSFDHKVIEEIIE